MGQMRAVWNCIILNIINSNNLLFFIRYSLKILKKTLSKRLTYWDANCVGVNQFSALRFRNGKKNSNEIESRHVLYFDD